MSSAPEKWEVGALSDIGPVREENQDRMCGRQVEAGRLYVVADGMGGHKGGALAAQLTVDGLCHRLGKVSRQASIDVELKHAFDHTNRTIYQKAHSGAAEKQGMGSTAVVLLISAQMAHVAHVGDSRAYLYRNGRLRRLTTDHSQAQKMIDAGMLTPEQALDHPASSILERAMGRKPAIEVDIAKGLRVKEGDGILLCTDGLSGYVDDAAIERVLRSRATVQEIPKRLFDLALKQGSDDNITVQYLRYGKKPRVRSPLKRFLFWTGVVVLAVPVLVGLYMGYGWYRENKITRLKQELTQVKEKYEAAGNHAQKLQDELAKFKNQLDNFEAERSSIEQKINHLEKKIDQKTIESTAANSTRDGLNNRIKEIERKLGNSPQKK